MGISHIVVLPKYSPAIKAFLCKYSCHDILMILLSEFRGLIFYFFGSQFLLLSCYFNSFLGGGEIMGIGNLFLFLSGNELQLVNKIFIVRIHNFKTI